MKKKKWIIIAVVALLILICAFGGGGESEPEDTADQPTTSETTEAATEATTEEKTEEEVAYEMGQTWFQMVDWDSVFKYKADVHYIADYECQKVTSDELKQYGEYVAMAGADLQNGFGAEFSSTVYIFMDKDGIAKHIFYDEADGSSVEIPMDSVPTVY